MREHAVKTNIKWAKLIGVSASTAVTCVKPSGTVSQLTDTSSGIHPRFSKYYIRTVRGSLRDPVTKLMMESGIPWEPEQCAPEQTVVFSFPVKAPEGCITVDDVGPIAQLELWKSYFEHWCEHQASITVYIRDHQWLGVGDWVYQHFDDIAGVSFLPRFDHVYPQAPYQEINEKQYQALLDKMPKSVNWLDLAKFEKDDGAVTATRELACSGGSCEIVDVV